METMKRDSRKSKSGLVLPVIAAIAICLALLGLAVLRLGFGSRLMATRTMAGVSARAAADAGITRALYEINNHFIVGGPGWDGTLPSAADVPLGNSNATYTYTTQHFLPDPPVILEDYWLITSIGKLGSQQSTVYATLGVRNKFEYGLIVTDGITLKQDSFVDGYISHNEIPYVKYDYGSALPDGSLNAYRTVKIGTTYSGHDPVIWLNNNATVTGQVLVGVGGNTEEIIKPLGTPGPKTGGYGNLPEAWLWDLQLLEITVPATILPIPDIDGGSPWDATGSIRIPEVVTVETTYVRIEDIDVPSGNKLIFVGNVELHITGDLLLKNSAALFVGDPMDLTVPSSVKIFLDGDLDVANGAVINNLSEIPGRFRLYGTGPPYQNWNIKNSGDYYGVYYGPNANIRTYAKAEFYGSVSGHEFILFDGGLLHYDSALAGESEFDIGFGIDRLWEKSDFIVAAGLDSRRIVE